MSDDFFQNLASGADTLEEARRRRLAQGAGEALTVARPVNPDRYVRNERAARILGLPPSVVADDPDVEDQARTVTDAEALRASPATAAFLARPGNAEAAHDQVEHLSMLESAFKSWTGRRWNRNDLFDNWRQGGRGGADDLRALGGGALQGLGSGFSGISATEAILNHRNSAALLDYLGEAFRHVGADVSGTPQPTDRIRDGQTYRSQLRARTSPTGLNTAVMGGIGQVGGNILVDVATGGGATLPMLYGQGVDQMRGMVEETTGTTTTADTVYTPAQQAAMLGGGVVTGFSEKFGLDAILGRMPEPIKKMVEGRLASILFAAAAEGTSEGVEQAGQNVLSNTFLGTDVPLTEGVVDNSSVGALVGSLVRTIILTAVPGRQHIVDQHKADMAEVDHAAFSDIVDTVVNSPLLARDPARMAAAMGHMDPAGTVYIPAEAMATFFQSHADLEPWLDEWNVRDQYQAALSTGADVAIPTADYLARIAPTEAHQAWAEDIRHGVEAMSLKEAKAFRENGEADLSSRMDAAVEQADQMGVDGAPQQAVYQDWFSQSRAAGMTVDVAHANATLMAAQMQRRAERSPQRFGDAMAAYREANVSIQREFPQSVRDRMDRTDVMIEALRKARKPASARRMFGRSLGEFIASEGGMLDTGGDLKAIGADGWHRAAKFRRKLIRERGEGDNAAYELDNVLTRAKEAEYLPEDATVDDLLEAIRKEVAGRPVYSRSGELDPAMDDNRQALDDLEQVLADLGLDPAANTNAEIKAALDRFSEAGPVDPDAAMYEQGRLATDRAAFKAWFGDSKVVDADGKPLVVYHGTNAEIGAFEVGRPTRNSGTFGSWDTTRSAIFFTPERAFAEAYIRKGGAENVVSAYLSIQRPFDMSMERIGLKGEVAYNELSDAMKAHGLDLGGLMQVNPDDMWENFDDETGVAFVETLKSLGYDGAILREKDDAGQRHDVFAAFRPEQIKSVFNRGAFDPADPRILYQSRTGPALNGVAIGALNRGMTREQHRVRNAISDAKSWDVVEVDPRSLVATQDAVNDDFRAPKTVAKGDMALPFVVRVNGLDYVQDGHHRVMAAIERGDTSVRVRLANVDEAVTPSPEAVARAAGERTFYQSEPSPPFFSALQRAVEASQTKAAPAAQWKATLAKTPGVKKEELEWSGINDWLDGQEGNVSRDQVLAFLRAGGVRVDEVMLGEPGVASEPDDDWLAAEIDRLMSEDEELTRADAHAIAITDWTDDQDTWEARNAPTQFSDWRLPGADDTYRELLLTLPNTGSGKANSITGPATHWDTENVIAHARLTGRTSLAPVEAERGEPAPDGLAADAQLLSDAVEAPTFITEGLSGLEVERQQAVVASVVRAIGDLQVRNLVVERVPVAVMNDLVAAETTAEVFFHDKAMLADSLSGNADAAVALSPDAVRALVSTVARLATERVASASDRARQSIANGSAPNTGNTHREVKTLFIEEIQSDHHQKGRDQGYRQAVSPEAVEAAEDKRNAAQDALTVARHTLDDLGRARYRGRSWFGSPVESLGYDDQMRAYGEMASEQGHQDIVDAAATFVAARLAFIEARQEAANLGNVTGIPDAPFRTSWPALVMKRMIRYAVDHGYERVAWTTGEQQSERYNLSEAVGMLSAARQSDGRLKVMVGNITAIPVLTQNDMAERASDGSGAIYMTDEQAKAAFGGDIAKSLTERADAAGGEYGRPLDASGLNVGGEGMRAFYDRNLVNITNDIVKRYGVKVGRIALAPDTGISDMRARAIRQAVERGDEARAADLREDAGIGPDQPGFEITPALRDAAQSGFPLFQRDQTGPRGQISMSPERAAVTLFTRADLSTPFHEAMGHLSLELLVRDAADPSASEQVKTDLRVALDYLNVRDPADIGEDQHELWARSWERYLMEGRAPSLELRSVFRSIKGWFVSIYKSVMALNAPITDEARALFDRLLASDEEIAQARESLKIEQGITDAAEAGMTEAEFSDYQRKVSAAREAGDDAMLQRMMRVIRAQRTAEWKAEADALRPEIAAHIDEQPDIKAINWLRSSKTPLNREIVVRMLGDEAGLALLPKGVPPLVGANGVHPDSVAEVSGHRSGVELLNALMELEAEKRRMVEQGDKRSVRAARIENTLTDRLREQMGDPLTDGSIEQEAMAALHTERQGEVLAMELSIFGRKVGQTPAPLIALREWARNKIGSKPVREARSGKYLRAERTAANAVQKAAAKKDRGEMFRQKQAQTLNHLLYSEARKAEEFAEKAIRRLSGLDRKRTIKSLDQDYLEQIHGLLEQYDLRKVSGVQVARRKALMDFVAEKEKAGEEVTIPPKLLEAASKKHYGDLTVDELRALDDTVKQLVHLGRMKQTLLVKGEQRRLDQVAEQAAKSAEHLPNVRRREGLKDEPGVIPRLISFGVSFEASLVKVQEWCRLLDGGDPAGIFSSVLDRPSMVASNLQSRLDREFFEPIIAAERAIPKEVKAKWHDRVDQHPLMDPSTASPLQRVLRDDLISMALHVGTMSNFEVLAKGWGFLAKDADEVALSAARDSFIAWLDTELHPTEWAYVQAWWAAFERNRPAYFETARSLNGYAPDPVEAAPLKTSAGDLTGGYIPVSYDPVFDKFQVARDQAEAQDMFGGMSAAGPRPDNGSTKERTGYVGPMHLDMNVVAGHARKHITYIAFGPYVQNSLRFIHHPTIRDTIRSKVGDDAYKSLEPWLAAQVKGMGQIDPAARPFVKAARWSRNNMTAALLLGSMNVLLAQPSGLAVSASTLGLGRMAGGLTKAAQLLAKQTMGQPGFDDFIFGRSDFMRNRLNEAGLDRDIRAALAQNKGQRSRKEMAAFLCGKAIAAVDVYLVSGPTWLAAYDKALTEGRDEDEAIYVADRAAEATQGGGRTASLAAIQRDNEITKMVTFAYGWANAFYNVQRGAAADLKNGVNQGHAAFQMAAILILPALADAVMSGDWPDDKDEDGLLAATMKWFARNVFFGAFSGLPVVRDVAGNLERKAAGKFAGPVGQTAFGRMFDEASKLGGDAWQWAFDEDHEPSKRWPSHVINTLGLILGIPGTMQAARTTNYVTDVAAEDQHPHGVIDWIAGLMKGPQDEQKEK